MRRRRATGAGVSRARWVYAETNHRKLPGVSYNYRGPRPGGVFFSPPCRPLAADGAATARPRWARTASTPIPLGTASPRRRRSGRPDLWFTPTARTATWPRASIPLGSDPIGDPALDPAYHGLADDALERIPAAALDLFVPARRSPTRCRACARPTPGRSRTRSSTSRAIASGSGCARRSSRAPTRSPSRPTSAATSSTACCASRRSSTTCTARSSARSSSRSRAST